MFVFPDCLLCVDSRRNLEVAAIMQRRLAEQPGLYR
jgi:hypothetical protein